MLLQISNTTNRDDTKAAMNLFQMTLYNKVFLSLYKIMANFTLYGPL